MIVDRHLSRFEVQTRFIWHNYIDVFLIGILGGIVGGIAVVGTAIFFATLW